MSWICFMRFIITLVCSLERWTVLFRGNSLYFSWTEMRSTYRVEIKGDYRFNLLLRGIHVCFIVANGFEYDMQKKHLRQTCPSKQIQLNTTPLLKSTWLINQSTTVLTLHKQQSFYSLNVPYPVARIKITSYKQIFKTP